MIQELLGGGGLVEERKISIPGGLLLDGHGHSPSSTGPSITPSSSATSSPSSSAENQNLRCPRCDSSNTKFCYYNNYNLTQPRHFCKTCRRYWTKGGALRNVPIGGGCRKSKSPGNSIGGSACKSGSGNKVRNCPSDMAGIGIKPSFVGGGGDGFSTHELPTGPVLWASSHNSNLMSDTNPNPNSIPVTMKEDLSHLVPDATLVANALNARILGFDHMGHVASTGFCTPLIWKNNQYQCQPQHQMLQQQQNNSTLFGTEVQSSSIQELYQRLRSSTTNNNYADHCQVLMGNMGSSPLLPPPTTAAITTATTITTTTAAAAAAATNTASVMEAIPVTAGGEFGFWNLPMSWSDMPTTNGAFP